MLPRLLSIANSLPLTWLVLFIPSVPFLYELMVYELYYAELLYETGMLSVQFLVFALALTPLLHLTRKWPTGITIVRWFIKRRRAIGIASFGYAVLHLLFYVRELGSWELAYLNAFEWDVLAGWVALFFMLALALTSNNASQRLLGSKWKAVQRTTYIAAAATALHWILFDQFLDDLWLWGLPLIALQGIRVARQQLKNQRRVPPPQAQTT